MLHECECQDETNHGPSWEDNPANHEPACEVAIADLRRHDFDLSGFVDGNDYTTEAVAASVSAAAYGEMVAAWVADLLTAHEFVCGCATERDLVTEQIRDAVGDTLDQWIRKVRKAQAA